MLVVMLVVWWNIPSKKIVVMVRTVEMVVNVTVVGVLYLSFC